MPSEPIWQKGKRSLDGIIREKFRLGMSRPYGVQIWTFLWEEFRGGGPQSRLSEAGGFDQGKVSAGASDGTLTFAQLVALAVGLEFELGDLPKKPPVAELAQAGFIGCLDHVRHEVWKRPWRKLDSIDLELLRKFWSDRRWFAVKGSDASHRRAALVDQIMGMLSAGARDRLESAAQGKMKYLEQLEADWIEAWDTCVRAVRSTYTWTKTT